MTQTSTAAAKITEPTAEEISARVATLPAVPTVTALDMLRAQAWVATDEERAVIKARADFFEWVGMDRSVHIKVVDVYTGARIGTLIYNI